MVSDHTPSRARGTAGGCSCSPAPSSPSPGSADTVSPASFPLGSLKQRKRKKEKGGRAVKETGAWKCTYNLTAFVGGGGRCESIRREPRFLPRGPAFLFPRLPSSPVFIWAKYVHAKVNSLPATHKLRMTCLAGLPYMESAVFQSSLPFAKFSGRKTPCMRGLLFFFFFFPSFCSASLKNCKKSKYRRSLGGAAVG